MMLRPLLLAALLAGGPFSVSLQAALLPVSEEEQRMLGIEVQAVRQEPAAGTAALPLRVGFSPDAEWLVRTPLSGVLQRAFVQQGDRVAAGDALVSVRSPEFVDLQRDYLKARAEMRMAEAARARDQRLRESGALSERRWQETRYAYDTALAELKGLEGQLLLAGMDAASLKALGGDAAIATDLVLKAPVDALVLERPPRLGAQLDGSEPLVRLGEPDKLVLSGNVARAVGERLQAGARIRSADGRWTAVLEYVSQVVDPDSQTVAVRAVPDRIDGLYPGQLAEWSVLAEGQVLVVPATAVVKLDDRDVVFVAVEGGFDRRDVVVQPGVGSHWVVLSGLAVGERVATRGTAVLKGMSLGLGGGDG
jgi:cobalt-zinc-cadmium efflux system membrane fusion protein